MKRFLARTLLVASVAVVPAAAVAVVVTDLFHIEGPWSGGVGFIFGYGGVGIALALTRGWREP